LEGRTVKKVKTTGPSIYISFTDGTYTRITLDYGYYAGEEEIVFDEPTRLNNDLAKELGLV
jgi:hypothetical protein